MRGKYCEGREAKSQAAVGGPLGRNKEQGQKGAASKKVESQTHPKK